MSCINLHFVARPKVPKCVASGLIHTPAWSEIVWKRFSIAAQCRSYKPTGPPLRLGSSSNLIAPESLDMRVLDCVLVPDRVLIVVTDQNGFVWVVNAHLGGPWANAILRGWGQGQNFVVRPPRRVEAKLTYDEKTTRVSVEITDTIGRSLHTIHEQKPDAWDFVQVKHWYEDVQTAPTKP